MDDLCPQMSFKIKVENGLVFIMTVGVKSNEHT